MQKKSLHNLDPISSHLNCNKQAIAIKNNIITYDKLNSIINNTINDLSTKNIGTKVALNISDPYKWIVMFWALTRMGKEIFLLNYKIKKYSKTILDNFKIKTIFDDNTEISITTVSNKHTLQQHKVDISKTKIYIFTSGTSGEPKCIYHNIQNFIISAFHVSKACKFNSDSKWILNLPLFHVSGLGVMFRSFIHGSKLLIGKINEFSDITHVSCVENQLLEIIKNENNKFKCILVGGSCISNELLKKALTANLPIYKTYGLSETASAVSIAKITPNTIHTSGTCLAHSKIKIINNIIYLQSESLSTYYVNHKNNKINKLTSWFKTNDLGYLDKNNLVVTGRKDSIVIINGENISCELIENVLKTNQNIINVKVIGVKINNENKICAFIKTNLNLKTLKYELITSIKNELSSLYIPNIFLKLPELNNLKYSIEELKTIAIKSYESASEL